MAKVWKYNNMFSLGEISPNLYHRFDLDSYRAGLKKLANGIPLVEGSVINAPELELVQDGVAQSSGYTRFYKYVSDSRQDYDCLLLAIDTVSCKIFKQTSGVFTLSKEIPVTYTVDQIKKLSMTQCENSVIICCEKQKPQMIRINETDLSETAIVKYWEAITDPPVKFKETEYAKTITDYNLGAWHKDRYTNKVTIKTSGGIYSSDFLNTLNGGEISVYGNTYRISGIKVEGEFVSFECTAISEEGISPPTVDKDGADQWEAFDVRKIYFYESIFNGNRYPSVCGYHQGRLVLANIDGNPDMICFSSVHNYFKFNGNVRQDDSGFTQIVPNSERSIITGIVSWSSLMVLTTGGVWSTPIMSALTPVNSFLTQQPIPKFSEITRNHVKSEGKLFYVNEYNNKVYTLDYNYDSKIYEAEEVSIYSRTMFKPGIKSIGVIAYSGNEYVACDLEDYYALCTYNKSQGVVAWSRYYKDPGAKDIIQFGNESYFFCFDNESNYRTMKFSYTVFRDDLEIELLEPYYDGNDAKMIDCPYTSKTKYRYSNVRVAVLGKFEIDVNGQKKQMAFGDTGDVPKLLMFDTVMADNVNSLNIKNRSKEPIEISAIYYAISADKEVF